MSSEQDTTQQPSSFNWKKMASIGGGLSVLAIVDSVSSIFTWLPRTVASIVPVAGKVVDSTLGTLLPVVAASYVYLSLAKKNRFWPLNRDNDATEDKEQSSSLSKEDARVAFDVMLDDFASVSGQAQGIAVENTNRASAFFTSEVKKRVPQQWQDFVAKHGQTVSERSSSAWTSTMTYYEKFKNGESKLPGRSSFMQMVWSYTSAKPAPDSAPPVEEVTAKLKKSQ
jgi:hypothetical protein